MQRLFIILFIAYITFIGGTLYTIRIPILTIFFHVVIGISAAVWLTTLIIQKRRWAHTSFNLPLLLYVILLIITSATAIYPRIALEQAWLMGVHVLWFYMLLDFVRAGKQRALFEGLFIASGVVVLISILEYASWYFGLGFVGYDQGWYAIGGLNDPIPPVSYKLSLALNVSTWLGNYAMVLLPIIVSWARTTSQRDLKIGLWLLAVAIFGVLIGSGSRGALGGFLAVLGVMSAFQLMTWQRTRKLFRPKWVFPTMFIGIVSIGILLMLFASSSDSTSDRRRADMWERSIEFITESPILGSGVGSFGAKYRVVRNTEFIQDKIVSAHNLWLNTTAEIGIGGFILLIWLGICFFIVWHQNWRTAPRPKQIRYEGILAALAGFCVHSTVDNFIASTSVLPILIISAYVMADEKNPHLPEKIQYNKWRRLAPIFVFAFLLISLAWLFTTDIARVRMLNAWRAFNDKDYTTALEYFEKAEAIDPKQGAYALQRAYVLGILANENPELYLLEAIEAHEAILEDNPTYDMGMANLSALYAMQSDYENALKLIERALAVHPDLWEYHLLHGRYLDKLSQHTEAEAAYVRALELAPYIALSPFWIAPDDTLPSRDEAMQAFLANTTPDIQVQVGLWLNDLAIVEQGLLQNDHDLSRQYLAQGRNAWAEGNLQRALEYYTSAIEAIDVTDTTEFAASTYAERAELYLELGQTELARKNANWAIFLDKVAGARGYYVLAQLALSDRSLSEETINEYLIKSVPPRFVIPKQYAGTIYFAPAMLDYLPQLKSKLPGRGDVAYQPWILLIERYENDTDPETDAQEVIDALLAEEPYTALLEANN